MQNATIHTDKAVLISEKDLEKLTIERNELKRQFDELTIERNELKRQFEELKRMIFGSKSERYIPIDDKQLRLFEDMLAKKEEELEKHTIVYQREKSKKKKEQPVRSAILAHFPRVEEIIEPDNFDPISIYFNI
jgi:transposase